MHLDILLQLANLVVLPAWFLLIFFPSFKFNTLIVTLLVSLLATAYTLLIWRGFTAFDLNSFSSLPALGRLFQDDFVLTAAWLHFLAFDLWVGHGIVTEGQQKQLGRWRYTLPLPFAFLFGPMGWLLFQALKTNVK
jgi:hypothetical protein